MTDPFLDECIAVLTRTPATLKALLHGLPDVWLAADEGPGTWSPLQVLGHLVHGERTDWIPRLEIVLRHGVTRAFDPFDREAHLQQPQAVSMETLIAEFAELRATNLERLREMDLPPEQLELQGVHPAFGRVTARQLLATWTAHDLAHILQVSRVMAKRLKTDVGPWAEYLSVMK